MIENLEQAVAKRNGPETVALTRRAALLGMTTALVASPTIEAKAALPATREDLEDYMLFLWNEHRRVAEELGVDPHDFLVLHRRGGKARYDEACQAPAMSRALTVLSTVGFNGAT